jgi:hypothetical protein
MLVVPSGLLHLPQRCYFPINIGFHRIPLFSTLLSLPIHPEVQHPQAVAFGIRSDEIDFTQTTPRLPIAKSVLTSSRTQGLAILK